MIGREKCINKLRDLGFKFSSQRPRVDLWRRGMDFVALPRKDQINEVWVRATLAQHGLTADEIESFIQSANS